MGQVWVLRVHKRAEVRTAMAAGLAPVDVGVREDVSGHGDIAAFLEEVRHALPDLPIRKAESRAQNLYALVREVRPGDLVLIHGNGVSSAVCVSGEHRTQDGIPALAFSDQISHTHLPEDFRNSLKAHITLSRAQTPDAFSRLTAIRATGTDAATDRLTEAQRLGSLLEAHELAHLVADLLGTDGYRCRISPPGPDGGVDIYAGKGLLGLGDSLLVQVKSGKQVVSGPQIHEIFGKLLECGSSATLIVSWSGFTAEAHKIMAKHPFKTIGWDHSTLLEVLHATQRDVAYKWQKKLNLLD